LKGDKEVVVAALKQDGRALQFASEELKGDREVVVAAVKQNGCALEYASEELKGDKEVVVAAVEQDGYALQFATNEIFGDDDVFVEFATNMIMNTESGKKVLHKMVEDPKNKDALHNLVQFNSSIAEIKDEKGRQAIDRAVPECKREMEKALRVFGRFSVDKGPRLHTSNTACVLKATSFKDTKETRVALKAMGKYDQVMAELNGREDLDSKYVVSIQAVYVDESVKQEEKNKIIQGADKCKAEYHTGEHVTQTIRGILAKSQDQVTDHSNNKISTDEGSNDATSDEEFPFIIVLDLGERDLADAILHDHITSGTKSHIVRHIMSDIANALHHLHNNDRIHADLKPLNAVRVGSNWKLIDMDVSCTIGEEFGTKVPSSGFCPPEMAKILLDATTDNKTGNINTSKLKEYKANIAYDLWSFGVLLYNLVKGVPLWGSTNHNGDVNDKELSKLCKLTSEQLSINQLLLEKDFQTVSALTVHDLLGKLLDPSPTTRVQNFKGSMRLVLEHPYFQSATMDQETLKGMRKEFREDFEELRQGNKRIEKELKALKSMTHENLSEIRLTRSVLLKGIFEATEVMVPTTFIILPKKLPDEVEQIPITDFLEEDGSGLNVDGNEMTKMAYDRFNDGMKWVDRTITFSSGCLKGDVDEVFGPVNNFFKDLITSETMYFYLIDEVTGNPVRGYNYPIEITKPSEIVHKLLPIMQVGMRAMSLYNGAAGIARMFGAPVPKVPEKWRTGAQSSIEVLKQESSVEKFGVVHNEVITTGNNQQQSVRGHSFRELKSFFEEHDKDRTFAELRRCYSDNGTAIWTKVEDENMLKAIEERTSNRKAEEMIHEDVTKVGIKALSNQAGATASIDENKLKAIEERTSNRKAEEMIHEDVTKVGIKALSNQTGATASIDVHGNKSKLSKILSSFKKCIPKKNLTNAQRMN